MVGGAKPTWEVENCSKLAKHRKVVMCVPLALPRPFQEYVFDIFWQTQELANLPYGQT